MRNEFTWRRGVTGRNTLAREGPAYAKALGQDRAWCVGGTARRLVWNREGEGERGRRGGQGRDRGGLCTVLGATGR